VIAKDSGMTFYFWGIAILGGVILFYYITHFWKVGDRPAFDYQSPAKLPQKAGAENRQHPRTEVNGPVSIETPEGTIDAEVKNISLGGAFICCKKPLPIGEVFHLTMIGPNNEPVIATAGVVWSNANVPDEKVINRGMGVRFTKISDRHIQLVRQLFQKSD